MRNERTIKYAHTLMQARDQLQLALVWMRDDNRTHLSRDMAQMVLNMYFDTVEKLVVSPPLPIATTNK